MKRNIIFATALTMCLLGSQTIFAQVAETKTYSDGSVYTGQINGRGKKDGQEIGRAHV